MIVQKIHSPHEADKCKQEEIEPLKSRLEMAQKLVQKVEEELSTAEKELDVSEKRREEFRQLLHVCGATTTTVRLTVRNLAGEVLVDTPDLFSALTPDDCTHENVAEFLGRNLLVRAVQGVPTTSQDKGIFYEDSWGDDAVLRSSLLREPQRFGLSSVVTSTSATTTSASGTRQQFSLSMVPAAFYRAIEEMGREETKKRGTSLADPSPLYEVDLVLSAGSGERA